MKIKNLLLTILIAASSGSLAYSIEPSSQQEQPGKKLQAQTRRQQLMKILKVLVPVVGVTTAIALAIRWYSKTNTPPAKGNDPVLTDQDNPRVKAPLREVALPALPKAKTPPPPRPAKTPPLPRPAREQFHPEEHSGESDKSEPEAPADKDSSGTKKSSSTSETKESVWQGEGDDPYPVARAVYNAAQAAKKEVKTPEEIMAIYLPEWDKKRPLSENDRYKSTRNRTFHQDRMPNDVTLCRSIETDFASLLKLIKITKPARQRTTNFNVDRTKL